jgi:two-component system, OmpR family, response regulator ArlR
MNSQKILIIEDEKQIVRFLELELQHDGYVVETAYDGIEGLSAAEKNKPDLILLDVMLPGLNGLEVCRRIRQSSGVPIIMLTARADISDKIMGLDMGATDYVTKPFMIEDLLARIRASLRRSSNNVVYGNILSVGGLVIDLDSRSTSRYGENIELTRHEFDMLAYIVINKGIVLTRDQILDNVWNHDFEGDDKIVDVYIRYSRNKIDDKHELKLIYTVRGVGYVLKENKDEE